MKVIYFILGFLFSVPLVSFGAFFKVVPLSGSLVVDGVEYTCLSYDKPVHAKNGRLMYTVDK